MSAPEKRLKILLIDDDPTLGDTLTRLFEQESMELRHSTSFRDAEAFLESEQPDLILLDIHMPDGNGRDWFRDQRKESLPPVIFLTSRGEPVDRVLGLELGADDYVVKPFHFDELLARVKTVMRRLKAARSTGDLKNEPSHNAFELDQAAKRICLHRIDLGLSRHEYGIVEALLSSPGRVYSREQLLEQAWEDPGSVLDRTVDAHIRRIRKKIRRIDDQEWIVTHAGFGYSLKPDR